MTKIGSELIGALGNRTSSWYVPVILIYTVLFAALAVFVSRIMAAVRERITYPRGGFVRPRLSGWKRHVAAMGLTLLALAIVTGALVAMRCFYSALEIEPKSGKSSSFGDYMRYSRHFSRTKQAFPTNVPEHPRTSTN